VGDVAIYVSSHTVNRFQKTRNDIQAAVLDVARCVYEWSETEDGAPYYDRVVVVGHSLGSVTAYDALNAMLREDEIGGSGLAVAERTSMLLTFGSPLDKTAFLFRNQRDDRSDVREALAAAVQPLIRDYGFRPPRWVNLWSPGDWIGASLAYYDDDDGAGGSKRIENVLDDEATTPLLAHQEHWSGRRLGHTLFEEAIR
jgi:pimeloyl-ACP methyl ester carboxylesterase